jgi:AhpD family alkylhydroperoxidase
MVGSSARVALLDERRAPLTAKRYFAEGDPGPIAASLAHVPELLEVALPFVGRALSGVTVDRRTAELVIVRASAMLSCTYCTLTHGAIALDSQVTPEEVVALCDPAGLDAFPDPREAALLAWVDAFATGRGEVAEEIADELAAHLDEATVVEIAMMAGCTIMLNRFCTSLRLPIAPSSLARLAEAGLTPQDLGR